MSLKYTRYEDICLKAGFKITLNALNEAFKKLIENDNSLIPENSIVPKIWECKWFNDQSVQGYSKGDAVWINTEPLDEFTSAKYYTILNYLLGNPFYKQKVEALQKAGNTASLFALCRNMVEAGKVFYIGNLKDPVQLKISLEDNNKDLPLDESPRWKNFFVQTDSQTNIDKFMSIIEAQTKDLLDLHLKTYHLPESFPVGNYLRRDFSNLDQTMVQRCKNIKYRSNLQGFDYVLLQVHKKYGSSEKWFRMWSSGYLEHGGTIDLESSSLPQGDVKTDRTYTVNLRWDYDFKEPGTSPTYEYEPVDFRDLYCTALSSDFEVGAGEEEKVSYDLKDMVSVKTRYVVSLTPMTSKPYKSDSLQDTLNIYETNAASSIDNTSFMFYFQPGAASKFMYYCSGFTTTMFDRVRKQADYQPEQPTVCQCR